MKKRFLLLLALLLASSALTACGSDAPDGETQAAVADETAGTVTETEDTTFVPDELPELDYGGADVNWFCGDYMAAYYEDVYAEAENGNAINDAVFRARFQVEERLGIGLNVTQYAFNWDTRNDFLNHGKAMVLSGDTTYDAWVGYTAGALVIEGGYFSDLSDHKYMDLAKPWWNQDMQEIMPDDTVYFVAGDATMTLIKHCLCLYFNEDLMADMGITDNLYDLVREGKWTFDTMEAMIQDAYMDLNGDGKTDKDDQFGLTFGDQNKYRQIPAATEVIISEKTADGYVFSFISERNNDVFTRFQTLVTANPAVRDAQANNDSNTDSFASFGGNYASTIFASGRSLFSASLVGDAAFILENSDFTMGMVPFPKYDEAQSDYHTAPQRNAMIYVPVTVVGEQFDRAGAVLEAWSSECYRSVMPTYFETNLKSRYSTDNDMAEMFDLLRQNMVVNLDYSFSTELPLNVDFFKQTKANFASDTQKQREACETALAELVAALKGE